MRITNSILYRAVKRSVQNAAQDVHKYQEQLSSGKKINSPSDNPLNAMRGQQLHTRLAKTDQYQRNNTYAKTWMQTTEAALSESSDLLIRLKELAVTHSSDQYTAEHRAGAAEEVRTLKDQLLSLANARSGDRSVFAGHDTLGPAFTRAGQYAGSDGEILINIDDGVSLQINVTGDTVFQSAEDKNIFETIDEFITALENNDTGGIRGVMGEIDSTATRVNSNLSLMGSRQNTLERSGSTNEDQKLIDTEQLGNVEDIDVVESVVNLQSAQNAFQAALMSSSQIGKLSLAQFI